MKKFFFVFCIMIIVAGCAPLAQLPKSEAEQRSGYTYIPAEAFPVKIVPGKRCNAQAPKYADLLMSLPDNAVRMLVEQINTSGGVTYGPAKIGANGEYYKVTVDYVNADVVSKKFWIAKMMKLKSGAATKWVRDDDWRTISIFDEKEDPDVIPDSEIYLVYTKLTDKQKVNENAYEEFNIPIYIGIGLRVSATVEVVGANANITGIGIIGAEAEANRLRGSLIVQTLGVNGKSVAAALPIQSELNRTTAQNAITAVSSIKALLYTSDTVLSPRVVGFYFPIQAKQALVNRLISAISKDEVEWQRPCEPTEPPK